MTRTKEKSKFGYAADRDAENWYSAPGCETREAAAAYALAQLPEAERVFVIDCKHGDATKLFEYASDMVERAEEAAGESEDFGHYEDSIFNHSKASLAKLDELLLRALNEWLVLFPTEDVWTTIGGEKTEHVRP
jgi:hypothetical protein